MTNAIETLTNAKISARILAFMTNGNMTLQEAIDTVCGPATYECLITEVYHQLRGELVA
jgi:hypothetical protein